MNRTEFYAEHSVWHRRKAKLSMPRTGTSSTGWSGIARTVRSTVSRPRGTPSRSASRAPARPATASPIAAIMAAAAGLRRLHGSVNPESCSAKVFVAQSMVSQKNRGPGCRPRPGTRRLQYRRVACDIGNALDVLRRHTVFSSHGRVSMRMVAPTRRTSRTSTLSKCGNKSIPPSSAHPKDPRPPMPVQVSDTPREGSREVLQIRCAQWARTTDSVRCTR